MANPSKRILFVCCPGTLPRLSTSGSPMILYSLLQRFGDLGWNCGVASLAKLKASPQVDETLAEARSRMGHEFGFWLHDSPGLESRAAFFSEECRKFKPDIIYCFGHRALQAVSSDAKGDAKVVATFYDPAYLALFGKFWFEFRSFNLRRIAITLLRLPLLARYVAAHFREELPSYAKADVVIGHAYNHAMAYARRLKRDIGYFPNPLEAVETVPRGDLGAVPNFLFTGGSKSTVSYTGLSFFAREVLPHIAGPLARGEMTVTLVGGGNFNYDTNILTRTPGILIKGHVSHAQLLAEYAAADALIVPTPIEVGFRTRIIDAFRYGVPTIAHTANRSGFREMTHEVNCLMADSGREFADQMIRLAADRPLGRRLAQTALKQFDDAFAVPHFVRYLLEKTAK
jgi:glycosyltransferase involved in cell wall biosynthesis